MDARQLRGYHAFAAAGGRFTFVTHNEKPIDQIVEDIARFERAHPGAVKAVEGPDELNNFQITYRGSSDDAAAKAYMADLYAAVKSKRTLSAAEVRVYGATDWPSISTMADLANIHSYERNGYGSHERLRLADVAHLPAAPTLGNRDRDDRLVHIQSDVRDKVHRPVPHA